MTDDSITDEFHSDSEWEREWEKTKAIFGMMAIYSKTNSRYNLRHKARTKSKFKSYFKLFLTSETQSSFSLFLPIKYSHSNSLSISIDIYYIYTHSQSFVCESLISEMYWLLLHWFFIAFGVRFPFEAHFIFNVMNWNFSLKLIVNRVSNKFCCWFYSLGIHINSKRIRIEIKKIKFDKRP